jgi:hypothetical protein
MVVALVGGVQAFVAGAHHERGDLQHGTAIGARRRRERAIAAIGLVEMVDDGGAVDQYLAVVEHQRRDAAEGILGLHLGAITKAGKRLLLVGHAVGPERDRDAACIGRTVYSDEQHATT